MGARTVPQARAPSHDSHATVCQVVLTEVKKTCLDTSCLERWKENGQSYQMKCNCQHENEDENDAKNDEGYIDAWSFLNCDAVRMFPKHHPTSVMLESLPFLNLRLAKSFLTPHSCEKQRLVFAVRVHTSTPLKVDRESCKSPGKMHAETLQVCNPQLLTLVPVFYHML